MGSERRRHELILAAGLAVLAAAVYWLWPSPSTATIAASNDRVAGGAPEVVARASAAAPRSAVMAARPEEGVQGTATPATEAAADPQEASAIAQEAAEPAAPAATPAAAARAPDGRTRQTPAPEAPSVHLTALDAERPKPVTTERNLFRFKPKPTPVPATAAGPSASVGRPDRPAPAAPASPPPPPPIALKFIGLVDQGGQKGKLAVLSDSAGHVFQGREGDIIEGRYRILKIGAESLEMAFLDGTGRRTVRLSGG